MKCQKPVSTETGQLHPERLAFLEVSVTQLRILRGEFIFFGPSQSDHSRSNITSGGLAVVLADDAGESRGEWLSVKGCAVRLLHAVDSVAAFDGRRSEL